MSPMELTDAEDALVEECIDEIDAAIEKLERFPERVLIKALAAHLVALTRTLADSGRMTQHEVVELSAAVVAELTPGDPDALEPAP